MSHATAPDRTTPRGPRRTGAAAAGPTAAGLLALVLAAPPHSVSAQQPVAGEAPPEGARVVLVTGSTGGLGREVARRLAADGAHVIVHGRSVERGTELVEEIERETPGTARFYPADLASFDAVRTLASAVRRDYDGVDVLVNNAGILLEPPRRESHDGHELHFQVNYLSGFLLTHLLLDMVVAEEGRIVNVSSVAQEAIDFDDVMLEEEYSDFRAYAQSKLAQIMFTMDLAAELEGTGVEVVAVHPASMMDTDMILERGMQPRSTVEEGARAVMHAIDGEVESGRYYRGLEPARAHGQAYDDQARARLRALSERLTGVGGG